MTNKLFFEMAPNVILVWAWEDAPKLLREFSTNGGDEDWLALVPEGYSHYIPWLDVSPTSLDQYDTPYGTVYISSHS